MDEAISKSESVALWHAVRAYQDMVIAMRGIEQFTNRQIEVEEERLATAKKALGKIQKSVREQKREVKHG